MPFPDSTKKAPNVFFEVTDFTGTVTSNSGILPESSIRVINGNSPVVPVVVPPVADFYGVIITLPPVADFYGSIYSSVPVADFTMSARYGLSPLSVEFIDTSLNRPTAWLWDFGDGNTSTLQNPTHIYSLPGTYTITLSASNSAGSNSSTDVGAVSVYVPSMWNLSTPPFSNVSNMVYETSNDGRTITALGYSTPTNAILETVSTPTKTSGKRYFELSYNGVGNLDQMGFATGDIAIAGGTVEYLDMPNGFLFAIAFSTGSGLNFAWFRKWNGMGGFSEQYINLPFSVEMGDIVGYDVDLDSAVINGIYLNGTRVLPDLLAGTDLDNWNSANSWTPTQQVAISMYQRKNRGDISVTMNTSQTTIINQIPSGSTSWDTTL